MNYKSETRKAYNKLAKDYEKKFEEYFKKHLENEVNAFTKKLPRKAKILDLGSGPGTHALAFKQHGFRPVCIDISPKMVALCQTKGLVATVGDFEKLEFPPNSFDAVWAYTSLLHTTKDKLPEILENIHKILKPKGMFAIAMKEGSGEDFKVSDKDNKSRRWFALYNNKELKSHLKQAGFRPISSSRTVVHPNQIFLNYLATKRT